MSSSTNLPPIPTPYDTASERVRAAFERIFAASNMWPWDLVPECNPPRWAQSATEKLALAVETVCKPDSGHTIAALQHFLRERAQATKDGLITHRICEDAPGWAVQKVNNPVPMSPRTERARRRLASAPAPDTAPSRKRQRQQRSPSLNTDTADISEDNNRLRSVPESDSDNDIAMGGFDFGRDEAGDDVAEENTDLAQAQGGGGGDAPMEGNDAPQVDVSTYAISL